MKLMTECPMIGLLIPYPFLDIATIGVTVLVDEKSSLWSSIEFGRICSSHTVAIPIICGLGAFRHVYRPSNRTKCSYKGCIEGVAAKIKEIVEIIEVAFFRKLAILFDIEDTDLCNGISSNLSTRSCDRLPTC